MSYLISTHRAEPRGLRKLLHLNWPLAVLLTAIACVGFLTLYSLAGGSAEPWMASQVKRFGLGLCVMLAVAMTPIWVWRSVSFLFYLGVLLLLLLVDLIGFAGGGAQRWVDLGVIRLQPSEPMKIAIVMVLAAYYDWLPVSRVSHPLWLAIPVALILLPAALILEQPDLGTALLVVAGGGAVMFLAGVHWLYFATVLGGIGGLVALVIESRGTPWQLLKDYQYRRIDTFLDPTSDPLGAGYNIAQAKIALGSGGWSGRGFMQGTQTRLNFLPEKHTDFILTAIGEELGFLGTASLLGLYMLTLVFGTATGLRTTDRFGSLLALGMVMTFFLYFFINMGMVMGMLPVVGVPLPLVSYGGSAMIALMVAFGFIQCAHVHRPR
ncbi:rod shape-determining protein RodA [Alloyangia pacifica]|uniref:rod shape-determining protein RodA n=1 Tax=Alloyangia pacifica TaxID=311180 RepID=UPI001CFF1F99|nr:rod shape-determining protein RodA [Alloyangia pacifica]